MSRGLFLIPAYQAAVTVGEVVRGLRAHSDAPILVVDDGSTDATREVALEAGADVLRHERNRGKGAALKTGFAQAARLGNFTVCVTVDADGQHPPEEAARLLDGDYPDNALVLGVRDLAAAGAPRPNQLSNRFSNQVLSWFGQMQLLDTQCGLRRYPIPETLALGVTDDSYAFEADVVLRAARRRQPPIVQVPVRVVYPPEEERISHFDSVRDPARIVRRVVHTALTVRRARP